MIIPFLNWRLRQKILLFSILIAFIPFALTNIFWYISAENRVRKTTENNIVLANEQAGYHVDDFINTELLGFFSHAQGAALLSHDPKLIEVDLANFLRQDPDIEEITYSDLKGQEVVKMDRNKIFPQLLLKNIADTDAFKVASFYFGKEYISPVTFSVDKVPQITIAVPINSPTDSESLRTFSSASKNPVPVGQISGILLGTVNLTQLANSFSSLHVGKSGYIYIVDQLGYIIASADPQQLGQTALKGSHTEITDFLAHQSILTHDIPAPSVFDSLKGVKVIGTYNVIDKTGWAAIVEEPVSDITSDIQQVQHQAYPSFIVSLGMVFILSFLFARTLSSPILKLVKGTQSVGKGNFDYKFSVHTHDEIEQLSTSYHVMAQNLKASQLSLEHERDALKGERNTLSTVLESIGDGVIALDNAYKIVFSNSALNRILGVNPEKIQGLMVDSVIHFKQKGTDVSIQQIIENSHELSWLEKLQFLIDDQVKTVRLVISALPDSEVSHIKYILTLYDLTKDEELESMKLDFVSMAAHELRTPLTSIRGYLSVFVDENAKQLNDEQQLFLKRIQLSTEELMALVENLLSVARIEKGAFTITPTPIDWVELAGDIISQFTYRAKEKEITLTFDKPKKKISQLKVDKIRITEVLSNLIANALEYTYKGGSITISVDEDKDNVITHVKDTGEGIPKNALPRLFSKFFRVSGYLSQGSKGTGLGLYISKAIVEMHKGKIWVESEGRDKGSTFSFSLPKN